MYTNIEFLDTEPIENVITALHFKVDKTIFIGYQDVKSEYERQTETFLKQYCGVKGVAFKTVGEMDIKGALQTLREVIEKEHEAGNQVFFDITGGEGLILVAFGMLAQEYHLPIHQYDIVSDRLYELNPEEASPISSYPELKKEKVKLDLDTYIKMQGAVISDKKIAGEMDTSNPVFMKKVEKLWEVLCDYRDRWNSYTEVLGSVFKTDTLYADAIVDSSRVRDLNRFQSYLERIKDTGAIYKLRMTNLQKENGLERVRISFFYESEDIKHCLIKSGNTLELHTFQRMKNISSDCRQSVMIDWDGVEHRNKGVDVLNEIDVLCMDGNIPIFISCKGGRMDDGQALDPMYELCAVAKRFGGKYAKKVLAVVHPLKDVYMSRAEEMGIEIRLAQKENQS